MTQTEDLADTVSAPEGAGRAFFRRTDWGAFAATFLAALAVYTWTLAPTVTLEDSGELAVASDYLGVPHPPGYPIWTLLTWFFQWIFHFVDYHGHPNPAWGVAFFSAFAGAVACGVLALLVSRSTADLLRSVPRFDELLGERTERLFCWAGGVAAGLLLAFSPVLWSQSVIVEVYSLNALFQILVMALLYRWMSRPRDLVALYAMAFVFGLGFTNHQTLLFLGLALAAGVFVADARLFRDFVIVGAGLIALFAVNLLAGKAQVMSLTWVQGPSTPAFWFYWVFVFAILAAGARWLPRGVPVAITVLLFILGVSFYFGYLPVASEQNPPMNWGYPRTWEGFVHAVTRGQYEKIQPTDLFSAKFIGQMFGFLTDVRRQFSLPLLLLGFLPFAVWQFRAGRRTLRAAPVALALNAAALILVGIEAAVEIPGQPDPAAIALSYKAVSALILLLAIVGVLLLLIEIVERLLRMARGEDPVTSVVAIVILAILAVGALFVYTMILKHVFTGGYGATAVLGTLLVLIAVPAFVAALTLLRHRSTALAFEFGEAGRGWTLCTVAGFVSVTFIFMAILNPALDLQTVFIQRVQFIQSHALFALWVGYGVAIGLALVETLARGAALLRWPLALAATILVPSVTLWKNWEDDYIVNTFGGAEQNGHDFGWQFGHWQLRGVNAIKEDLQADLGPAEFEKAWAEYPNKDYPPEMSSNAVFFGGTDPGRFVPTYMIYSAKVRPDVFLITQNALADNTYLNVMRDLYGDEIWIPAIQDSNTAFQQYLADIQSGRIAAGADVSLAGGRISVQGVGGVMAINGILAKMIFDHNKARHEFYVEESYVIPWMYEYLTPHGLIMKINREPTPLPDEMVRLDREFWDWYCKRLLGDTKFLRDVVARKTFSKLRSAIAGLYAYRGRFADAEHAFRQSIALYPLSPEATFRLADMFVAAGRFDDARGLMTDFQKADPMNDKVQGFVNHIGEMEKVTKRRQELMQMDATGRLDVNGALELAEMYRRFQQPAPFEMLVRRMVANQPPLPPDALLQLGQSCANSGRLDLLETILGKYLELQPGDLRIMVELAAVYSARGNAGGALDLLRKAVERGGMPIVERIRPDPRFQPLRNLPAFQQLIPPMGSGAPFSMPPGLQNLLK